MLAPREHADPYVIASKSGQTLKFTKIDADNTAQNMQLAGRDVEVYHKGLLQYRLNGIHQGELFQQ